MIVLDENVFESQRAQLRHWRIRARHIGFDVGRMGIQDEEIIPLLRTLRRPTFVSWDRDFFSKALANDRYSLVFLDVPALEVAHYTRRLLKHPEFKTWSQRKGCVIRAAPNGISVWRAHVPQMQRLRWQRGR